MKADINFLNTFLNVRMYLRVHMYDWQMIVVIDSNRRNDCADFTAIHLIFPYFYFHACPIILMDMRLIENKMKKNTQNNINY